MSSLAGAHNIINNIISNLISKKALDADRSTTSINLYGIITSIMIAVPSDVSPPELISSPQPAIGYITRHGHNNSRDLDPKSIFVQVAHHVIHLGGVHWELQRRWMHAKEINVFWIH